MPLMWRRCFSLPVSTMTDAIPALTLAIARLPGDAKLYYQRGYSLMAYGAIWRGRTAISPGRCSWTRPWPMPMPERRGCPIDKATSATAGREAALGDEPRAPDNEEGWTVAAMTPPTR